MTRDANNDAQRALYALLSGAEGCGTAARSASLVWGATREAERG